MYGPFKHITTLLIANRSEIAARIQATAHRYGLRTICVYTPEDASAPHLRYADAVYPLSASGAAGYLNQTELLSIAQHAGADAVHPGYGFLAENHTFAAAVIDASLRWVGPLPATILAMGDKAAARIHAQKLNIPVVPGTSFSRPEDEADAARFAAESGYPVLLKAARGGGGKGMRRVDDPADFSAAWLEVVGVGQRLFGSSEVVIEKFVVNPRHIEVQIAGDGTSMIHFFERECSIQRNNQKIIEEAPAPFLSDDTRTKIRNYALQLARALHYRSVGTVEFMVANQHGSPTSGDDISGDDIEDAIYFLEVNTRLQVEHAVTEQVTGVDLVGLQLHLAEEHPLPFQQDTITCRGHSIECRLYTEQPEENFRPATGTISLYEYYEHPFARYDHSITTPHIVTPLFDPMLSKIIATGSTRQEAAATMLQLLQRYIIVGVATNKQFLLHILTHQEFVSGSLHTQSMSVLLDSFARFRTSQNDGQRNNSRRNDSQQQDSQQGDTSPCLPHATALATTIAQLHSEAAPTSTPTAPAASCWKVSSWK